MGIQDAVKDLSARPGRVETLLRKKVIPSFVLGSADVAGPVGIGSIHGVPERDRQDGAQTTAKEETVISLEK